MTHENPGSGPQIPQDLTADQSGGYQGAGDVAADRPSSGTGTGTGDPVTPAAGHQASDAGYGVVGESRPDQPAERLEGVKEAAASGATDVKDAAVAGATELKDAALERGGDVAAVAKDELGKVADEARTQLRSLWGQTSEQLKTQAGAGKQQLADLLHTLAGELGEMASKSEQSGPLTALARQGAIRGGELSHWLNTAEPTDVMVEIRRFARRRPVLFLAGALAAGVVVGRLSRGLMAAESETSTASGSRLAAGTSPAVSSGYGPAYATTPASAPAVESAGSSPSVGDSAGGTSDSSGGTTDPAGATGVGGYQPGVGGYQSGSPGTTWRESGGTEPGVQR